jgi:hypothetical protein
MKNFLQFFGAYKNDRIVSESNQSNLKKVLIEDLLPDKDNMEVAVDSLHKGNYSSDDAPITVYENEGKYIVADGHHRLLQAIVNGEAYMRVKILHSDIPISTQGTIELDFSDGDYYGLDSSLENGWLIKRL